MCDNTFKGFPYFPGVATSVLWVCMRNSDGSHCSWEDSPTPLHQWLQAGSAAPGCFWFKAPLGHLISQAEHHPICQTQNTRTPHSLPLLTLPKTIEAWYQRLPTQPLVPYLHNPQPHFVEARDSLQQLQQLQPISALANPLMASKPSRTGFGRRCTAFGQKFGNTGSHCPSTVGWSLIVWFGPKYRMGYGPHQHVLPLSQCCCPLPVHYPRPKWPSHCCHH